MRELAVFYCPKCGYYAYYQTSRHPQCPRCCHPDVMHMVRMYYKEFMDMGCRERDDYLAQEIMKDNRELLQLHRFGILALQYLLFLVFSLWAPLLAMLGVATVLFCLCLGLLDNGLLLQILFLSLLFKLLLSISAFQARAEDFSLVPKEIPRFFLLCLLGSTLYRLCITCARIQGLFSRTKRQ